MERVVSGERVCVVDTKRQIKAKGRNHHDERLKRDILSVCNLGKKSL